MDGLWACLIWAGLILSIIVLNKIVRARRSTPTKTGKAWEQDAPYPECFEEDDDNDL